MLNNHKQSFKEGDYYVKPKAIRDSDTPGKTSFRKELQHLDDNKRSV